MKQPPSIQPASRPGPDYDPLDRIVENLQNIEAFLSKLEDQPEDLSYLNSHLPQILPLRRTISHQLSLLQDEPYSYSQERLATLHRENENLFLHLEGVVGSMHPLNEERFNKFMKAALQTLEALDGNLTP